MAFTIEIHLPSRRRVRERAKASVAAVKRTVKAIFSRILSLPKVILYPLAFWTLVLGLVGTLYATAVITFWLFAVPLALVFSVDFAVACWVVAWMLSYYGLIWWAVDAYSSHEVTVSATTGRRPIAVLA